MTWWLAAEIPEESFVTEKKNVVSQQGENL
jgi:hypothetical protein